MNSFLVKLKWNIIHSDNIVNLTFELLPFELVQQLRQDCLCVADDSDVRDLEDRGVGVLVDGDDFFR